MPDQDDVYVLPDDDILQSLRRDRMLRRAARPGAPAAAASIPVTATATAQSRAQVLPIAADIGPPARRAGAAPREQWSAGPNPAAAASLSIFLWGSGQMYAGHTQMGMFLLLTQALAPIGHWSLARIWPGLVEIGGTMSVTEWALFRFFAAADLLLVALFVFNVVHAYRCAVARGGAFDGTRWPVLSGAASFLVPGWGQILNGEVGKAAFFLLCLGAEIYAVVLVAFTPIRRIVEEAQLGGILAAEPGLATAAIAVAAAMTWAVSVWDAVVVAAMRRRTA